MSYYQKIFEQLYFPLFESVIKKRNTAKLFFDSLQSQWCPSADIDKNRIMSLHTLLTHASLYSPFYKNLFNALNVDISDFTSVTDLSQLPILTKDIILNY